MKEKNSKKEILYTKPSITELEIQYVDDAIRNGWGKDCYKYIDLFESLFKSHLGVNYAIATSSCTGALHLGLSALGISYGDEVIIADTNWVATASPIIHLGAKPVLVDILEDTWCIDPEKVEDAITPKTKAIIAVHLYGNLCDMNRLIEIGNKYNIPVIEDAAESFGSEYFGRKAGNIGEFGAFSFHGTKTLTTGEGGMFVTNNQKLYEKVLTLSNHGRSRNQTKQFWPDIIGFKYKMSNIQAALGCAQIERAEYLINFKRETFHKYKYVLKDLPLSMNIEKKGCKNGFWMPTIVFNAFSDLDIEKLMKNFKEEAISVRPFFWPLSITPIAEKCILKNSPISKNIYKRSLNLPSNFEMNEEDFERISKVILDFFN